MDKLLNSVKETELRKIPAFSLENYETKARFCQIYDGDSCKAVFPFQGKLYKWSCRLLGLDTPELRSKNPLEKEAAKEARTALRDLLTGKTLKIKCHDFDKYGRLLITILKEDGEEVKDNLIKRKFGRAYDGGRRKPWEY